MSGPVPTPGQRLKEERERRGLSTQKAADELRVDVWVIDALEAGDYERIGPAVYGKGHLKRYAAMLGLPREEILAGYDASAPTAVAASAPTGGARLLNASPPFENLPWPQIAGAVIAVLVVAGIVWWKPWHQRVATRPAAPAHAEMPVDVAPAAAASAPADVPAAHATDTPGAAPPAAAVAAPTPTPIAAPAIAHLAPASTPVAAPPPASPRIALAAAAPSAAAASRVADAAAGAGKAHLRLRFTADSWVDVHDATGRRVFSGHGRANSVKIIAGTAPMKIYLGSASGVQLEINQRAVAIGAQFVAGDVARFEAGADGVLRRDPTVSAHGAHPRG